MLNEVKYKKINIILTVIEVFLLAAIVILNNIKFDKMGIVRHITFWNAYKFPKIFTQSNLKIIIVILCILIVLQVLLYFKNRKNISHVAFNILIMGLTCYYIYTNNVTGEFIYYYIVIFFLSINVLQFLKFLTLKK